MSRIYLASSWRNARQPDVLHAMRANGHEVYDFRNPPGGAGFGWEQTRPGHTLGSHEHMSADLDPAEYLAMLDHPLASEGFRSDFDAMHWADVIALLLPCGRSAHLELGWGAGNGKRTLVILDDTVDEPELMYLMCDHIARDLTDALAWLEGTDKCPWCGRTDDLVVEDGLLWCPVCEWWFGEDEEEVQL